MTHNDEFGKLAEAHVEKLEAEREALDKREWELREEYERSTDFDKLRNYSFACFDEDDLWSLRLKYVPEHIKPCPHCENLRRTALRKEMLYARGRNHDASKISSLEDKAAILLFAACVGGIGLLIEAIHILAKAF